MQPNYNATNYLPGRHTINYRRATAGRSGLPSSFQGARTPPVAAENGAVNGTATAWGDLNPTERKARVDDMVAKMRALANRGGTASLVDIHRDFGIPPEDSRPALVRGGFLPYLSNLELRSGQTYDTAVYFRLERTGTLESRAEQKPKEVAGVNYDPTAVRQNLVELARALLKAVKEDAVGASAIVDRNDFRHVTARIPENTLSAFYGAVAIDVASRFLTFRTITSEYITTRRLLELLISENGDLDGIKSKKNSLAVKTPPVSSIFDTRRNPISSSTEP